MEGFTDGGQDAGLAGLGIFKEGEFLDNEGVTVS